MTIRPAELEEIPEVRALFREYEAELQVDLCFQSFEEELAGLPGKYAPPAGTILLAEAEGAIAGCVALRPLEEGVCEMKRLFVRPSFRGLKIGEALVQAVLQEAKRIGYARMRLDTLERLVPALRLYEKYGFRRIEPYYRNPEADVVYMELDLRPNS